MIIEQLISNYVDGDLTPDQDQELRELVAADPAARKLFDEAVLVHIAMRCEDETEVPDDLRADVFSQIDAIAQEEEHLRAATAILRQDRTRVPRRMAAVLAVLFALWVPISEGNFGFADPINLFVEVPQVVEEKTSPNATEISGQNEPSRLIEPVAEFADHANQLNMVDQEVHGSQSMVTTPSLAAKTDGITNHVSGSVHGQGGSQTLASFFGGSGSGSRTYPRANGTSPYTEGEDASAPVSQMYDEDQPAFISVTTSYAAGVSTSLPNTSDVEQLAASIGFGVTEDDLVGLELGSTSYSYTRTSSLTEQTGASVSRMAMVNDNGDGDGKLASPTPTTGSYETTEFIDQQRAFSVWGTAFYERRLLNIESFSLLGRAGAGVATDGVVGYGRVTSELALGSAISLIVGAEARAMPFRLGPIQGTGSSKQYGTVFTALTGLHVRF